MKKSHVRIFYIFMMMMSLSFHTLSQKTCPKKNVILSKTIEYSGDTLQIILPFLSLSHTLLLRDSIGTYQLCSAIASSTIATWIPKISINQKRPNGGNQSMPSGHTSLSFVSSIFFLIRYGVTTLSLTMKNMASFVALSRMYTQWHYCMDIIIGFFIGLISALFWTKKIKTLKKNRFAL
jgi:membrane-associated phospholipid phosphatase